MKLHHNRIPEYPAWIAPNLKKNNLGLPLPPRKPELRTPIYWLSSRGNELYFVNASHLVIEKLSSTATGWFTVDDEAMTTVESVQYEYFNVLPNEAVLIESFDEMLDSDFNFQLSLHLDTTQYGHIQMLMPISIENKLDIVLLWNNGDTHKHLGLQKHSPSHG